MLRTIHGVAFAFLLLHRLFISSVAEADELIARWQFDSTHIDGTRCQALAGPLDATVVGPVQFAAEPPQALRLDGDSKSEHRVTITGDLARIELPGKAMTVEAWCKVDELLEWGGIAGVIQDNGSYERGWLLGYRNSRFCFAVASQGAGRLTYLMSEQHFEPGNWYHVAGTYDGTVQKLFVDGQLAAESRDQAGPIAYAPQAPFAIGAYHDDNELHSMTGEIDRVSLWKRALSEKEITDGFDSRKSRFPGIEPAPSTVKDWPTYLHDNRRTGVADVELQFPLTLKWVHRMRHPPQPAWPAPAYQDFWHKKTDLQARVIYDRACHLVTVGNRVYFGTSADDRVVCLDAASGRTVWQFFAEGPVRLSPTIAGEKVLFGSDDGLVYCLNARDGSLLWTYRPGPADRRIPGNERIVSVWPVRTGVLVEDNIAYFCAGLFPSQGAFQAAVNIDTGEALASSSVGTSPQGYLERIGGRLHVPTGRDPAGVFAARLQRRGKGVAQEVGRIPDDYPFAFIGAGDIRLGGGDGKVAAFRVEDGGQIWAAPVEGKAYSMAVAQGRLFVSTDAGHVYCFSAGTNTETVRVDPPRKAAFPYPDERTRQQAAEVAERILDRAKIEAGYCLILGSGEGRLAYELATRTDLKIVGVCSDPEKAERSRQALAAVGLYGRVAVHRCDPSGRLPYTDYLFNLVVCDASDSKGTCTDLRDEVRRVLRPYGGVAIFGPCDDQIVRRGPLAGAGQWTHMYADPANTTCSSDERVSGRMQLQWFGPPGPRQMIDRHHRTVAPLCSNGRLFVPAYDRVIAVDAYNGTRLWNASFPNSRRVGVFRDCSYMAAADDFLYVAAADRCHEVKAATGEITRTFSVPPDGTSGEKREWGYVSVVDDLVFGSAVRPGASRRGHSRAQIEEGTYYDSRPLVGSQSLVAFDRSDGHTRWDYHPQSGAIVNPTITIGGGRVMFVESGNEETLQTPHGRSRLSELLGHGACVVALRAQDGSVAWTQPCDFGAIQHVIYAGYSQGKLVLVGSRNSGSDREKSRVLFDVHVLHAETGETVWATTQDQGTKIGGSHGEQDHHPVIVRDRLYCEPYAYELHTGKPLAPWAWNQEHRRGCGTLSASAAALFFRQANPAMYDLTTNRYSRVTTVTRPGCWINMIPAGGLLLIPEASSGCTCDFAVQASLAFLPAAPSEAGR